MFEGKSPTRVSPARQEVVAPKPPKAPTRRQPSNKRRSSKGQPWLTKMPVKRLWLRRREISSQQQRSGTASMEVEKAKATLQAGKAARSAMVSQTSAKAMVYGATKDFLF